MPGNVRREVRYNVMPGDRAGVCNWTFLVVNTAGHYTLIRERILEQVAPDGRGFTEADSGPIPGTPWIHAVCLSYSSKTSELERPWEIYRRKDGVTPDSSLRDMTHSQLRKFLGMSD
jgi:hypothetical protein